MRIARVMLSLVLTISQLQFMVPSASAVDMSSVVISHIIGGEGNGQHGSELVALYNNTSSDIEVTNYCLKDGNETAASLACIQAESNTKVYIPTHKYLTIASDVFLSQHPTYTADASYISSNSSSASKISISGDTLTLVDSGGNKVDQVTWGSGKLVSGGMLIRKESAPGSGILLDTDSSPTTDFTSVSTFVAGDYPANSSYDIQTIIDLCPNLEGIDQVLPFGYLVDNQGNCRLDACLNLSDLQITVPEYYDADANKNCTERDECANLEGKQHEIPEFMSRGVGNDCIIEYSPLILTEIMPNANGSDTGNEFIEIYNPSNQTIDLTLYAVKIGDNTIKSFPIGSMIAPGEYRTFSDSLMKFTLVNTSSRVILTAIGGTTFGDTGVYDSPPDGQSWALVEGMWQYTNRPTPGAANLTSLTEEYPADLTDTGPAPCPVGKYRNPLTNRCRNIESDVSVLATCDTDQYRNPETGRCKKISVTSLAPCKDNQYRSEETNRCRNIVTASSQKPCKDNQYRSEETNRCRNLPAGSVPDAAFAVQPVKDTGMAFVGWWALGGVGLLAAGYAAWEWRRELVAIWKRFVP